MIGNLDSFTWHRELTGGYFGEDFICPGLLINSLTKNPQRLNYWYNLTTSMLPWLFCLTKTELIGWCVRYVIGNKNFFTTFSCLITLTSMLATVIFSIIYLSLLTFDPKENIDDTFRVKFNKVLFLVVKLNALKWLKADWHRRERSTRQDY